MKLLIVFNPRASSSRANRLLSRLQQEFSNLGVGADFLLTERCGHASELVAKSALADYDGIVAAGGDGSVFEVLNGLYRHDRKTRIPLGIIPLGTGNAFARDLGLGPGEWQRAVSIVTAGKVRDVDVGQVMTSTETFYFLNIIGMGFAVDAGRTSKKLKRLGNIAYTLGTLWQTLKLKSYPLRIEIDGHLLEQDNIFVEISNTRYTGTSFLIAPGAEMDDGLLDITLLRKLPRLRLLQLFPTIYSGRHVEYEEISVVQGKNIRILAPQSYPLAPDGEFHGTTPAEIVCLHRDLKIFSP